MKKGLIAVIAVIAILIIPIFSSYNGLVSMEEDVNGKWSQVENVLKRRADLIPNLVNTVKGYADHEEEVLTKVTEARSKLQTANTPGELAEADNQLTEAVSRLNFVVESYPELKADKNFTQLMDELSGTENRIATERKRYNEAVQAFNTKIKRFPTKIVASIFNFDAKEYFKISEADRENPVVDFSN
ncbi:MAG: LemA family protein [Andreesenia angusta]|nr:LemA family protein [Andreesenia angusta]